MLFYSLLLYSLFSLFLYNSICLGYMAFLTGGIYAQNIQSAQIEFSALNTINITCTSCHTCNICGKIVIVVLFIILYTYLSFLFFNKTL